MRHTPERSEADWPPTSTARPPVGPRARGPIGSMRGCGTGVVLSLAIAAFALPASAAFDRLSLVSRAEGNRGVGANGISGQADLTPDGRHIAFFSQATNLHRDDQDPTFDVYVRERRTGRLTLASRADGRAGAKGNGASFHAQISADGRFVVFASEASNLDPADTDASWDVFVRDLRRQETSLVSRAEGFNGAKANGMASQPAMSADGRMIAFTSDASNLDPADRDPRSDVFVRDVKTGQTTLVSRGPAVEREGHSFGPSISADGRLAAFHSSAMLSPDDRDAALDVYTRSLRSARIALVSRANGHRGPKGDGESSAPQLSADGRFVAFHSMATNIHSHDTDPTFDVFVRDLWTHENTLVSRARGRSGAKGNDMSIDASISASGRAVTFFSHATNLDRADTDSLQDVYYRDLRTGELTLVSRAEGRPRVKGNGHSRLARLSGNGRFVAFDSQATNLHPDDTDPLFDVFLRDMRGG